MAVQQFWGLREAWHVAGLIYATNRNALFVNLQRWDALIVEWSTGERCQKAGPLCNFLGRVWAVCADPRLNRPGKGQVAVEGGWHKMPRPKPAPSPAKKQEHNPNRFYCPWPNCKRSFAELWRLKVCARQLVSYPRPVVSVLTCSGTLL